MDFLDFLLTMYLDGPPPKTPARPWDDERDAKLLDYQGHDCPAPGCGAPMCWCEAGDKKTRHTHCCRECGFRWQHDPRADDNGTWK
jgi:hypothetical protein